MKNLLKKYHPEGVRVVGTYNCKRNCKFCYQKSRKSDVLSLNKYNSILQEMMENKFNPIYFTFQGGEISDYPDESYEWIKSTDKFFPQVFRKSITSNGLGDIDYYKDSKLIGITHITFSLHNSNFKEVEEKLLILKNDGFFTVRVNCFLDFDNVDNVKYVFEFCSKNNIQLTLCEDLRLDQKVDKLKSESFLLENKIIDDSYNLDIYKHQTIFSSIKNNYRFWVYKHLDHYDYNNIIIKPDGDITMTFDDIINSK
jgi:molybdenum cofactor biosynthesis enzyme MoaA